MGDEVKDVEMDAFVKCGTCSRIKRVQVEGCLRRGWPRCCRETMYLVTFDQKIFVCAIKNIMAPLEAAVRRLSE